MKTALADNIRRFLAARGRLRRAEPSELNVTIMLAHRVQIWFAHHRGMALTRSHCARCGKERLFTIWGDGTYRCLNCAYRRAWTKDGHDALSRWNGQAAEEFKSTWLGYVERIEASEDPWVSPGGSSVIRLARLAPLRPPPICEMGRCETCDDFRPFMLREDGDAGCIACLMRGRTVELEIEVGVEAVA